MKWRTALPQAEDTTVTHDANEDLFYKFEFLIVRNLFRIRLQEVEYEREHNDALIAERDEGMLLLVCVCVCVFVAVPVIAF